MHPTVDASRSRSDQQADRPHSERRWWAEAPLDREGAMTIAGGVGVVIVAMTIFGVLVVAVWEGSIVGRLEADVNEWFAARRTPTWTNLSDYASMLSDTGTMVAGAVVLLPVLLITFRRWHDWTFLVGALVLEVTTFVTTSTLIGRERPPVEQLDGAPTASFPSGHVAAAVVFYVGLAVIVSWHRTERRVRIPFVVLAVVAPTVVAASRLYRGMHYLTDVVAGALLGLAVLAVMWLALERSAGQPPTVTSGARHHP